MISRLPTVSRRMRLRTATPLPTRLQRWRRGRCYAADHIKRVLTTFPRVFSGIGEFSIHKEFVSPKVAGGNATLTDQALHRILDFAREVGLVMILHNDADVPFRSLRRNHMS